MKRISRRTMRAVWMLLVGGSLLLLTSCMGLMMVAAAGVAYGLDSYESRSAGSSTAVSRSEPVRSQYTGGEAGLVDAQISAVWNQCEREGIRDYDRNGDVNCCDRATAFCIKWKKLYPRSIRLCQQQTAAINHMYVQLYMSGYGWWSVDPCYTASGTHDMKMVWGRQYSRTRDDTDGYWVTYFSQYVQ